jgi:hypothetical protein
MCSAVYGKSDQGKCKLTRSLYSYNTPRSLTSLYISLLIATFSTIITIQGDLLRKINIINNPLHSAVVCRANFATIDCLLIDAVTARSACSSQFYQLSPASPHNHRQRSSVLPSGATYLSQLLGTLRTRQPIAVFTPHVSVATTS